MDCQVVRKFLQVYLDREFSEDDRCDLEEHLKSCPACNARAGYERRFRKAIQARVPKPVTPAEFRRQIVQLIEKQPVSNLFSKRLMMWSTVPAAVALALVVSFNWTMTTGFSDEAVAQHSMEEPIEVGSGNSKEVETWFRSKVNFNVALPHFGRPRLSLVGGRLSHLANRQVALIRYRLGHRNLSLFVMSDNGEVNFRGQNCKKVAEKQVCSSEIRGFSLLSWRSRGLLYSVVSDADPSDLLKLLFSSAQK
jgi:anti-sigma factor (TIGR02949 family)